MAKSKYNPFRLIGAFAPSSRGLANAMACHVGNISDFTKILEVGAGTGSITRAIIKNRRASQKIDVVEIMPRFASILHYRFADVHGFNIYCKDILDFTEDDGYDLLICSLPFNAFLPDMTAAVIEHLIDLARPGAVLSFFEYKVLQNMAPFVLPQKKFAQFLESRKLIERFIERFKFDEAVVSFNLPPAVVHYLRIDKQSEL